MAERVPLPEIRSMGRSIFDPVWALREHASTGIELVHVLRGQVQVRTNDYTIDAREGDTIYTPNGKPHTDVFPLDSTFEVYLVHFSWAGEKEMLDQWSPPQLTKLDDATRLHIASEMRQLYHDFLSRQPMSRTIANLRLLQIVYSMCRGAAVAAGQTDQGDESDSRQGRPALIMHSAKKLINERFADELTLDTIAEAIDISPYYLSRVFSEQSGFTLSSYLTSVRMEKAVELLRDVKLNVSQVARSVGYRDPHYFSKVFKAHLGASPSAYRSKNLSN